MTDAIANSCHSLASARIAGRSKWRATPYCTAANDTVTTAARKDDLVGPKMIGTIPGTNMQRDEFRPLDVDSVVHALIAPIQYLIVYRHCMAACPLNPAPLVAGCSRPPHPPAPIPK